MTASLLPYALTTLQRVKDRMYDTNAGAAVPTAFDDVLIRMINGCTDWIEKECGGRRFLFTLYTNQVYSAYGAKQRYLITKQAPIVTKISSFDSISGSPTITVPSTAEFRAGMPVLGDSIPAGTFISSIVNTTTAILTAPVGTTQTTASMQVNGLINFQWRAGTPATNPGWTNFIPDQFETVDDGKAGIIRLYGVMPRLYNNMARVTYYAGYLINWIYAGDGVNHTLPADLSDTCENMVVRKFKRRQLAGKSSEALGDATTSWRDEADADDKAVIGHYSLIPPIF